MKYNLDGVIVCVFGLGYVGLPLAEAFAKKVRVVGFDIDRKKIEKLHRTNDAQNLLCTDDPKKIKEADFILICVPTPVTMSKEPELSYVESAAQTVGRNLKKGATVILES